MTQTARGLILQFGNSDCGDMVNKIKFKTMLLSEYSKKLSNKHKYLLNRIFFLTEIEHTND